MNSPALDEETVQAIKESIDAWKRKVKHIKEGKFIMVDMSPRTCPLCHIFYENYCFGCPILKKTRKLECNGSPYVEAVEALRELLRCEHKETEEMKKKTLLAFYEEIKFLESLLPTSTEGAQ